MPVTVVDKDGNLKIAPAALSSLAWGLLTGTLSDQTDLAAALALKAPLASPTFTGTPAAPTAGAGTNTTQLATTAFVFAESALKQGIAGSSAPTTTGTSTALAIPSGTGPLTLYLNNASLLTVQGIAAGIADQLLFVFSKGAGQVDFAHLHASGTALGKLYLVATVGLTSLAAGKGAAVFQYDATATVWRLIAHEQGTWISEPYAAGNFTASGAMTWTVDAGDVGTVAYWLKGRTLSIQVAIGASSLGGTAGLALQVSMPGGYTIPARAQTGLIGLHLWSVNAGTTRAFGIILPTATLLVCYQSPVVAWTLNTNLTELNFMCAVEVN